jgi:hypothetical protein
VERGFSIGQGFGVSHQIIYASSGGRDTQRSRDPVAATLGHLILSLQDKEPDMAGLTNIPCRFATRDLWGEHPIAAARLHA